jgi:hypothetical protein
VGSNSSPAFPKRLNGFESRRGMFSMPSIYTRYWRISMVFKAA